LFSGWVQTERGRVAWSAAIALTYFGAAKLGLALAFATPSVTAIWPPAGIAIAALVLFGPRVWPAVAAGAFLANVTTDVPIYTTVGITIGNTLEAVAGAWLLRRVGFRPSLRRLRDVFALVTLSGALSTAIAASIGVASLYIGDQVSGDLLSVWRVWWLGDMGGVLLVAPFILVAVTHWPYSQVPGRAAEVAALAICLVAVGLLAFSADVRAEFLVFPLLIWAALRFWQPGATSAALVVATIAITFTINDSGPFVESSEDDSLLLAQAFSGVAGLTALVLAILSSQRAEVARRTAAIAHTLQTALLPPQLPWTGSLDTAAWHRPSARGQEIGGDFYDLFQSAPDVWDGVIGDVCGKGPAAASLTGLARHTLRAVAGESPHPSEVLLRLNQAVIEQGDPSRFLTASYVRIRREDGGHAVAVCNGGHPPPLLVRAEGRVDRAGSAGMLLGVFDEPILTDQELTLEPGDALVFFTDGLVDVHEAGDGFGWLREALRDCAGASAEAIADRVRREAGPRAADLDDDQAVLVLRSSGD
jgi:integral membrane sensor domain MASE1